MQNPEITKTSIESTEIDGNKVTPIVNKNIKGTSTSTRINTALDDIPAVDMETISSNLKKAELAENKENGIPPEQQVTNALSEMEEIDINSIPEYNSNIDSRFKDTFDTKEFKIGSDVYELIDDYADYTDQENGDFSYSQILNKYGSFYEADAQTQGGFTKVMKGIPRILTRATHDVVDMGLHTAGFARWIFKDGLDKNKFVDVVDNSYTRAADNFFKELDNAALTKIYNRAEYNTASFGSSLMSAEFWGEDAASGIGSFLSYLVPGAALKILNIAKGLELLGMGAKLAGKMEVGIGAGINTVMESSAEAAGVVNDLKAQGITDRNVLSVQGLKSFADNVLITAAPNMIMQGLMFGKSSPNKFKTANGLWKNPKQIVSEMSVGNTLKTIGEPIISEGAEEIFQYGSEQNRSNKKDFEENYFTGMLNSIKRTAVGLGETEGQKSLFLGSLLGALGGVHGAVRDKKARFSTAEGLRKSLTEINNSFIGLENLYKTKVEYDDAGNPTIKLDLKDGLIVEKDPEKIYKELQRIGGLYARSVVIEALHIKNAGEVDASVKIEELPLSVEQKDYINSLSEKAAKEAYSDEMNNSILEWIIPHLAVEGGAEVANDKLNEVLNSSSIVGKYLRESKLTDFFKEQINSLQEEYIDLETHPEKLKVTAKTDKHIKYKNAFIERLKIMKLSALFNTNLLDAKIKDKEAEIEKLLKASEDLNKSAEFAYAKKRGTEHKKSNTKARNRELKAQIQQKKEEFKNLTDNNLQDNKDVQKEIQELEKEQKKVQEQETQEQLKQEKTQHRVHHEYVLEHKRLTSELKALYEEKEYFQKQSAGLTNKNSRQDLFDNFVGIKYKNKYKQAKYEAEQNLKKEKQTAERYSIITANQYNSKLRKLQLDLNTANINKISETLDKYTKDINEDTKLSDEHKKTLLDTISKFKSALDEVNSTRNVQVEALNMMLNNNVEGLQQLLTDVSNDKNLTTKKYTILNIYVNKLLDDLTIYGAVRVTAKSIARSTIDKNGKKVTIITDVINNDFEEANEKNKEKIDSYNATGILEKTPTKKSTKESTKKPVRNVTKDTAENVLLAILQHGTEREKVLAKNLLNVLDFSAIKFEYSNDLNAPGKHNKGTITINTKLSTNATTLHEYLHALLYQKGSTEYFNTISAIFKSTLKSFEENADEASKEMYKRMTEAFDKNHNLKDFFDGLTDEEVVLAEKLYGLLNESEFHSTITTDEDFQRYLDSLGIKVDGISVVKRTLKTFFEEILKIFNSFTGKTLKKDDPLYQSLVALANLQPVEDTPTVENENTESESTEHTTDDTTVTEELIKDEPISPENPIEPVEPDDNNFPDEPNPTPDLEASQVDNVGSENENTSEPDFKQDDVVIYKGEVYTVVRLTKSRVIIADVNNNTKTVHPKSLTLESSNTVIDEFEDTQKTVKTNTENEIKAEQYSIKKIESADNETTANGEFQTKANAVAHKTTEDVGNADGTHSSKKVTNTGRNLIDAHLQKGDKVTLAAVDDDSIEMYTFDEAGNRKTTTWGEFKKTASSQEDIIDYQPIGIYSNGKLIGYVHTPDWVFNNAQTFENGVIETEKLHNIRKDILAKEENIEVKVESVTGGVLSIAEVAENGIFYPEKDTLENRISEDTPIIIMHADGSISSTHNINTTELLENNTNLIYGHPYIVIKDLNGSLRAVAIRHNTLDNLLALNPTHTIKALVAAATFATTKSNLDSIEFEPFKNLVAKGIEYAKQLNIDITPDNVAKYSLTGENGSTLSLVNYISQFLYQQSDEEFENAVQEQSTKKNGKPAFKFKVVTINNINTLQFNFISEFLTANGDDGVRFINLMNSKVNVISKQQKILNILNGSFTDALSAQRTNLNARALRNNKTIKVVNESNGEIETLDYNTYARKATTTVLEASKDNDDNLYHFIQPTVRLNLSSITDNSENVQSTEEEISSITPFATNNNNVEVDTGEGIDDEFTFTSRNLKKLKESTENLLVHGTTLKLQTRILNVLNTEIYSYILKEGNISNGYKLSGAKIEAFLDSKIEELKHNVELTKTEPNKKANRTGRYSKTQYKNLDKILNSSDTIKYNIKRALNTTLGITHNEELEDLIKDSRGKQQNWDMDSFQINPNIGVSAEVKIFLSTLTTGKFLGFNMSRSMNDSFKILRNVLKDLPPNKKVMLNELAKFTKAYPEFKILIEKLNDASNQQISNKFVSQMCGHVASGVFIFENTAYSKDSKKTETVVTVEKSDANDITKVILDKWAKNLFDSKYVKLENGEHYFINKKEIIKELESIRVVNTATLKPVLDALGIKLSDELYNEIETGKYFYKGKKVTLTVVRNLVKLTLTSNKDTVSTATRNVSLNTSNIFGQTFLKALAKEDSKYNATETANAHMEGTKKVYSYGLNYRLKQLEAKLLGKFDNFSSYAKGTFTSIFSRNSAWLKNAYYMDKDGNIKPRENSSFLANFAIGTVSLQAHKKAKAKNKDNADFRAIERKEKEITALGFMHASRTDNSGNNDRIISLLYLTPSNKKKSPLVTVPAFKANFKPFSEENANYEYTEETIQRMFDQLVAPELDRIRSFEQLEAANKLDVATNYKNGYKAFYIIPALNALYINEDGSLRADYNSDNVRREAKKLMLSTLSKLTSETTDYWVKEGIGVTTDRFNSPHINSKFLSSEHVTLDKRTPRGLLVSIALDFNLQYLIGNANMTMALAGDIASFYKGKVPIQNLSIEDKNAAIQVTFENLGKRLAKDIAPGTEYTDNTEDGSESNITYAVAADLRLDSNALEEIKKVSNENNFKGITATDAQEFVTFTHRLSLLARDGSISEILADKIINTVKSEIKKGNHFYMDNVRAILSPKELKEFNAIIFKPTKLEYTGNTFNKVDADTNIKQELYVKSSDIVLQQEELYGKQLDKVRIAMEKAEVDRLPFSTAAKVSGQSNEKHVNLFNENGDVLDIETITESLNNGKFVVSLRGLKEQQKLPSHGENSHINTVTQTSKNWLTDVISLDDFIDFSGNTKTGDELLADYSTELQKIYDASFENLKTFLGVKIDGNGRLDLTELDYDNLKALLKKSALQTRNDINTEHYIEYSDKDLRSLSFAPVDFESIMNSLVKSELLSNKMPGSSLVVVTEAGLRNVTEDDEIYSGKYGNVTIPLALNRTIHTKGYTGELKHGECFVQWKFRDIDGKLLNIEDYLDEDGNLDEKKFTPEMLTIFSMRIPNQGLNFQKSLKIVGFLPYNSGDRIVTSRDLTITMGQDFDIDKLYCYTYNYYIKSDGTVARLNEEGVNNLNTYVKSLGLNSIAELKEAIIGRLKESKIENIDLQAEISRNQKAVNTLNAEFDKSSTPKNLKELIYNVIEDLKSLRTKEKLTSSEIEDLKYNLYLIDKLSNSTHIAQNNIVDIHHTVHQNKNTVVQAKLLKQENALFLEKSGDEETVVSKIIQIEEKKNSTKNFIGFSAKYQLDKKQQGSFAQTAVGIFANDIILNSLGQQILKKSGRGLSMAHQVINWGTNDNGIIDLTGSKNNFKSKDGKYYRSDIHSAWLTIEVDDENAQIAGHLNVNKITIPFIKAMNHMGYSTITPLILVQPIIQEYVDALNTLKHSDEYVSNAEDIVIKQLLKKYNYSEQQIQFYFTSELLEDGENIRSADRYTNKSLTEKQLFKMLEAEDIHKFDSIQAAIFIKFLKTAEIGATIASAQQLLNIDSKGYGKDFAHAIALEESIAKSAEHPPIKEFSKLFENSILKNSLKALSLNNVLWQDSNFYLNANTEAVIKIIVDLSSKSFESVSSKAEFYRTMYKLLKAYMMTSKNTLWSNEDTNLTSERERILKGKNSIQVRTKLLRSSDNFNLKSNVFLNSLTVESSKYNLAKVTQLITNIEDSTSDEMIKSFIDLALMDVTVDGVNVKEYAEDLVKAAVLNGEMYGAIDYSKSIPAILLHSVPFMQELVNLSDSYKMNVNDFFNVKNAALIREKGFKALDINTIPPVVLQIFRNSPELVSGRINRNILPKNPGTHVSIPLEAGKLPESIFSIYSYNRKQNPYKLYVLVGESTNKNGTPINAEYLEVGVLNVGNTIKEFDASLKPGSLVKGVNVSTNTKQLNNTYSKITKSANFAKTSEHAVGKTLYIEEESDTKSESAKEQLHDIENISGFKQEFEDDRPPLHNTTIANSIQDVAEPLTDYDDIEENPIPDKAVEDAILSNTNKDEEFAIQKRLSKKHSLKSINRTVKQGAYIKDRLTDILPNITDTQLEQIYNNYVNLMHRGGRKGKEMSLNVFKGFALNSNVYNYKDTFIFGYYDTTTNVFITTASSSPTSKELLAEALPNIVKNFDVIGFAPKDVVDKYKRSGFVVSNVSYKYNFKGEIMDKFLYASNTDIIKKILNKDISNVTEEDLHSLDTRTLGNIEFKTLLNELLDNKEDFNQNVVNKALKNLRVLPHMRFDFITYLKNNKEDKIFTKSHLIPLIKKLYDFKKVDITEKEKNALNQAVQNTDTELNSLLVNYLSNFGIKTVYLEDFQKNTGLDSLGTIEILNKILLIDKNNTEELPEQASKFIVYMLQYNPLLTSIYTELRIQKRYAKASKTELLDITAELLAEQLHIKTSTKIPKTLQQKLKLLLDYFWNFVNNLKKEKINREIGIIADSVLARNLSLITASKYKPGSPEKKVIPISLRESLKTDKFANTIVNIMAKEGFILTGSTVVAEQGTIYRPITNQIHDLDWVNPFSDIQTEKILNRIFPTRIHIRNIYNNDSNSYTHTFLISPENTYIKNIKFEGINNIIRSYDIVDNGGKIVGTYTNQNGVEVHTGIRGFPIDLFMNNEGRLAPSNVKLSNGTNLKISNWKDVFTAKLEYARLKDIWDYNRFIPNENIENNNQISNNSSQDEFAILKRKVKEINSNPDNKYIAEVVQVFKDNNTTETIPQIHFKSKNQQETPTASLLDVRKEEFKNTYFGKLAPDADLLLKSIDMLDRNKEIKKLKDSERSNNKLSTKIDQLKETQLKDKGTEFFKGEIKKLEIKDEKYVTLELKPLTLALNDVVEVAAFVTDKMVEKQKVKCSKG